MRSLGHPPKGLQVLVNLVSTFLRCKKLNFTPLNQSLMQRLNTDSPEPYNLGQKHNRHVNTDTVNSMW